MIYKEKSQKNTQKKHFMWVFLHDWVLGWVFWCQPCLDGLVLYCLEVFIFLPTLNSFYYRREYFDFALGFVVLISILGRIWLNQNIKPDISFCTIKNKKENYSNIKLKRWNGSVPFLARNRLSSTFFSNPRWGTYFNLKVRKQKLVELY